jgi:hypothetical protein
MSEALKNTARAGGATVGGGFGLPFFYPGTP